MTNLFDALNDEISRNEELLRVYRSLPTGGLGAVMVQQDLAIAKTARSNSDVIVMMQSYETLKDNK